ncbi:MAG: Fic family protein [Solirubrobacterales bacterium]|nr:Fic family protein [Solirubrobacterales bacterium]OJU94804.1 MAG: cell filamentation protein Fic [Solirubrobacterales bacterium 67-14]
MAAKSDRAGRFIREPTGSYSAFVPKPLPPDPSLELSNDLSLSLSEADTALGRLDGIVGVVPDPDLFVGMYVRREAVLSSQIEGTQSSLGDLLQEELEPAPDGLTDVQDIVRYVAAMNYGLDRLDSLPLSLRLIREIHAELLDGGRGSTATPGDFRKTQNWIGPQGATLSTATFVPPSVPEMNNALDAFEKFLHQPQELPTLIEVGLAHAQFETIHPFLDGNGRVGRLLVTLLLVERGVLARPLLYLSHYFKLHRLEYYDRLMAVRLEGDWEGWIKFFLEGVSTTAQEATLTAKRIFELRERHRQMILDQNMGQHALTLLSDLFRRPIIDVKRAAEIMGTSFATANGVVAKMETIGILRETTGQKRFRKYRYEPYVELFEDGGEDSTVPAEVTGPE